MNTVRLPSLRAKTPVIPQIVIIPFVVQQIPQFVILPNRVIVSLATSGSVASDADSIISLMKGSSE